MIEKIYIPTFRRVDTQTALNNIPQKYKDKVVLVVQEQERKKYKYDVDYLVVGNNIGIANTRKIIYDNSKNIKFGMIDDDVIFYRRNSRYYDLEPNMEVSKRVMIDSDWDDMFDRILEYLDDEDVLMVGHREYTFPPIVDSKRKRGGISKNLGVFGAVWIDGKKLSTFVDDIEWSQFPICEDLVLNMETLLHGYGTVRMDEFAMKQYYNNHAPGGCSTFRNEKVYLDVDKKLLTKWPKYIRIRGSDKQTPSHIRWYDREVKKLGFNPPDYIFDWKKLYKDGQIKKQSNLESFME